MDASAIQPMNIEPQSILVAEDHAETRETITLCLTAMGHDVTSVNDGREAIRCLEHRAFDVIVTDMIMPEADGLEVIMAARKVQPSAKVVAVSGGGEFFSASAVLKTAQLLGAAEQLAKPFTREQLVGAVARVARHHDVVHAA